MPMPTASTSAATSRPYYLHVRQDWLDRRKEPILESHHVRRGVARAVGGAEVGSSGQGCRG